VFHGILDQFGTGLNVELFHHPVLVMFNVLVEISKIDAISLPDFPSARSCKISRLSGAKFS